MYLVLVDLYISLSYDTIWLIIYTQISNVNEYLAFNWFFFQKSYYRLPYAIQSRLSKLFKNKMQEKLILYNSKPV